MEMQIVRGIFPPIKKRKIDLANCMEYSIINQVYLTQAINKVITENIYSTIDLLKVIKEEYNGKIKDTITNIKSYEHVRFNCYYAAKKLKEELERQGIHTHYISCKSIGFSNRVGDKLIKEAHIALLLPTKKKKK